MSLIRLDDNRVARLQQYPSGYIASPLAVAIGCSLRSLSVAEQAYDNARNMRVIAYDILLLPIRLDG
jgi:hypothetical protein